jgi:hypothetical protein
MKKVEREVFKVLCGEIGTNLCSFCKFAQWYGCDEGNDCNHPIEVKYEKLLPYGYLDSGIDCWGFRNSLDVSDIADIVGIVLNNEWGEWGYNIKDDGKIKVYGRK